jgi:hypothetical protein
MAWIDEIERCQPLQLKPLLPEHSFRVPLPADTSGADGCKRIVIFLNGDTLIARKEQTRFVRYEGKISQWRKLLDVSFVATCSKDGNATLLKWRSIAASWDHQS